MRGINDGYKKRFGRYFDNEWTEWMTRGNDKTLETLEVRDLEAVK